MEKLITILGPTATGKTTLAAHLATKINGEIISADSRQVYRGMDIGTGKDIEDYEVDGVKVNYHLVDIVEPGYEFNLFEFAKYFGEAYDLIIHDNKIPILCGGTGLYLDAVLRGYSIEKVGQNIQLRKELESYTQTDLEDRLTKITKVHNTTDTIDRERTIRAIEIAEHQLTSLQDDEPIPEVSSVNFGIHFDRSIIRQRITERLSARLNQGMIKEVADLLERGLKPEQLMFYGLEYRFVTQHIIGDISFDEMFQKLNTAIHQFAKRQSTWFRRMEKKGVKINWIEGEKSTVEKLAEITKVLKQN